MSINNGLKAYVRYDGTGRIVPGGPIYSRTKPKNGDWVEIDSVDCCTTTTTTSTTTVAPTTTTTSTTTTPPYYTFTLAYQSVQEGVCLLTPNQDFYSDSPYLFVGTTPPAYLGSIVYTDTALTIPASNGYYYNGSIIWQVSNIAGNPGEVTDSYICA